MAILFSIWSAVTIEQFEMFLSQLPEWLGLVVTALAIGPVFWPFFVIGWLMPNIWGKIFFGSENVLGICLIMVLILSLNLGILIGLKKLIKWILEKKNARFYLQNRETWSIVWKIILVFFWLWMTTSILLSTQWFLIDDGPRMSRYAVLNAAIKNTCFVNPEEGNCPQTVEEISYIEPEEWQRVIVGDNVQTNYIYDVKTGFYTWVVRYAPNRAIIFDWRFTMEEGQPDFRERVKVDYWKNRIETEEVPEWIDKSVLQFSEWDWGRGWR